MLDDLIHRLKQRDRLALSRLMTFVSRGQNVDEIRAALEGEERRGRVVAFTGSAGVGKSSLVGKVIDQLRADGKSVAVIACDPESPLTGGALLGDRIRMTAEPDDELFIRSLAVPSGQQGVAANLDLTIQLALVYGFDLILLETVGAGQGDTAVRQVAESVVLLVQPEAGDELQWEKAGVLEIADVIVVHKSDLPQADKTEAQLNQLLNLPGCRPVRVLRASALRGEGIAELCRAVVD